MSKGKTSNQLAVILKGLKEESGQEKRKIFIITTFLDEEDEGERTLFLKKPTRLVREASEKMTSKSGYKGLEALMRGMYLGGDDLEEVIKNDDAITIAGPDVYEAATLRKGGLKVV